MSAGVSARECQCPTCPSWASKTRALSSHAEAVCPLRTLADLLPARDGLRVARWSARASGSSRIPGVSSFAMGARCSSRKTSRRLRSRCPVGIEWASGIRRDAHGHHAAPDPPLRQHAMSAGGRLRPIHSAGGRSADRPSGEERIAGVNASDAGNHSPRSCSGVATGNTSMRSAGTGVQLAITRLRAI